MMAPACDSRKVSATHKVGDKSNIPVVAMKLALYGGWVSLVVIAVVLFWDNRFAADFFTSDRFGIVAFSVIPLSIPAFGVAFVCLLRGRYRSAAVSFFCESWGNRNWHIGLFSYNIPIIY